MDVHVGKFIMKECLIKYLKASTRVLVTHALYYLKYVDFVYLIENGAIIESGEYEEIKSKEKFKIVYDHCMKD